MPKKVQVSSEVFELAVEAAQKAKTPDDLRMAQAVLIPGLLDVPDRVTGRIIGRSRVTVVQLRKKFGTLEQSQPRKRGGRRYGYMTIEQERQFLSRFLEKATQGGILVVSEIHRAFEALVGHKVAQSTIYRASCKKSEPSEQIDSSAHEQAIFDDNRYSPVTVLPLKHKVVGF
jgi:hypothetical protein